MHMKHKIQQHPCNLIRCSKRFQCLMLESRTNCIVLSQLSENRHKRVSDIVFHLDGVHKSHIIIIALIFRVSGPIAKVIFLSVKWRHRRWKHSFFFWIMQKREMCNMRIGVYFAFKFIFADWLQLQNRIISSIFIIFDLINTFYLHPVNLHVVQIKDGLNVIQIRNGEKLNRTS